MSVRSSARLARVHPSRIIATKRRTSQRARSRMAKLLMRRGCSTSAARRVVHHSAVGDRILCLWVRAGNKTRFCLPSWFLSEWKCATYSVSARRSDASPNKTSLDRHSSFTERTHRSANAFKFGLCCSKATGRTPADFSTFRNAGHSYRGRVADTVGCGGGPFLHLLRSWPSATSTRPSDVG